VEDLELSRRSGAPHPRRSAAAIALASARHSAVAEPSDSSTAVQIEHRVDAPRSSSLPSAAIPNMLA
jgi:hypothetical protein